MNPQSEGTKALRATRNLHLYACIETAALWCDTCAEVDDFITESMFTASIYLEAYQTQLAATAAFA
ncbi:hypothetical protein J2777_001252 [Paraburkholderia graminis]|uniref:hypothetical protein n=1 Tax=Paraburkholderia graminis TaxID=60548 RepID=UPI0028550516|nr:hypothetical protein [Paraburkholderia graminis]MDR6467559.1 hypothetical protein [Paraburkholderia graminis]